MNYFKGKNFQLDVPNSSARKNERYEVYLKISTDYGFVDEAKIIINQQKRTNEKEIRMFYITTEKNMNIFTCEIPLEDIGLHYFCVKITINGKTTWIKNDIQNKCAVITDEDKPYWTITVYDNKFEIPKWAQGKIMYQIFPDRFFKSDKYVPKEIPDRVIKEWNEMPNWKPEEDGDIHNNDYFMGNLKGIEEKLDYIKQLGVSIIYLNPICYSQSNHRYDTSDYELVDPYLGTNDDLKELCEKCHKVGIRIVIDGVFNHTGNDSKYFNEYGKFDTIGAFQGEESPYYNWYKKNSNGDFEYWWGFKNLPVCDGNNEEWQNYIYGVGGIIDKWFALGIDGIRLDVADELTDEFIENVRKAVKRNKPDGFIIGEVWDNAVTKEGYGKQRTYLLGRGLDSVMNYPFTNAILKYIRFGRSEFLIETLDEILTQYPKEVINSIMNSLSTHDITRAMTTLVGDGIQNSRFNWVWDVPYSREWQYKRNKLSPEKYEEAKQLMKLATTIQYFLPGNACIYYGDEVGLYGYRDPFNRRCFPWDNIDADLHDFFVKLGKIKNKYNFLSEAEFKIIRADSDVLIFERFVSDDEEDDEFSQNRRKRHIKNRVLVAINRSENEVEIEIPEIYENSKNELEINCLDKKMMKNSILIKAM